ncbi:MAG: HD domain-containing protein [Nanoarchaeota archaeon]|nr:HD domain-containing protein [Nanoarchaeota archaeon]
MTQSIERMVENELSAIGIPIGESCFIIGYLDLVREKDLPTYYHSMRVGLLSSKIARHLGLDEKTLLIAGLTHDIGKVLIEKDILQKKGVLTEKEMEKIKGHPVYSYELLKDKYRTCAEIVLRHHKYQSNSYPKEDQGADKFSPDMRSRIEDCAKALSLADIYDALTTRVNYRLNKDRLSKEEVKSILLKEKPYISSIITDLYAKGILGES